MENKQLSMTNNYFILGIHIMIWSHEDNTYEMLLFVYNIINYYFE